MRQLRLQEGRESGRDGLLIVTERRPPGPTSVQRHDGIGTRVAAHHADEYGAHRAADLLRPRRANPSRICPGAICAPERCLHATCRSRAGLSQDCPVPERPPDALDGASVLAYAHLDAAMP